MSEIKKYVKKTRKFFKNNKTQNIIAISLILFSLILGTVIRLEVLPNLVDETTGDYTPLALDPYYFLRISETMLNGGLPAVDSMRDPLVPTPWSSEILPSTTVWIYKIMHAFEPSVTLRFANVLNPTIFFFLGLIAFGFLIWILTKNKWVTSISIFLLSIVPPYLYRTIAGFSFHDSIGMFGFFFGFFFFFFVFFFLEKNKKHYLKSGLYGLLAGFFTMFAIASWGGIAKFLTMILPLSFLLTWLIKKDKLKIQYLIFYSAWLFSLILSAIPLNFSPI